MLLETSTQRLEIPEDIHRNVWTRSQTAASSGLRLQIYSNLVCQEILQPWWEDEFADTPIAVRTHPPNPQQWEWVTGFSVELQPADRPPVKLVCLPSETMDRSELRVPQEWVDLPRWIGDYYLAVEVNPDEQWLEIWAYTTHAQLKTRGSYDGCDRTYCLSHPDLIADLSCLWVMLQVGTETTRRAVAPLPNLSAERRDALMQHLSRTENILPRLQLPFEDWGAFLEEADLVERVCQQRQVELSRSSEAEGASQVGLTLGGNLPATRFQLVRLSQWLDNIFETGWQSLEDLLGTTPELALGLRRESTAAAPRRVKAVDLGEPHPPLWLLVGLEPEADGRLGIRIRLLPMSVDAHLPESVSLTLRSAEGDEVQSVQARQGDQSIQLKRFRCPQGTAFNVEVAIADVIVSEAFLT